MWLLLNNIAQQTTSEEDVCLVTLVGKQGSTYRRLGAKMLITSKGKIYGSISAGCLEQDVAHHAQEVLKIKQAKTIHYHLDDDTVLGFGVGCGGAITLLLEAVNPEWMNAFVKEKQTTACVQVVQSTNKNISLGIKKIIRNGKLLWTDDKCDVLINNKRVKTLMNNAVDKNNSVITNVEIDDDTYQVLIDIMHPPQKLIIFGAGEDAIPLASYANTLGFDVIVTDHRPVYLNAERFPNGYTISWQELQQKVASNVAHIDFNESTSVVIMSHHIEKDGEALQAFTKTPVGYIGILGPQQRFERLVTQYTSLSKHEVDRNERLHHPIGLDIGADTMEEVALSIMAEIVATQKGFSGGQLRFKERGIHDV